MAQSNQQYSDELLGFLFNNAEKKELADKQDTEKWPDYKGSAEIEGVQYWVSGWIKTAKKSGEKFISLSFTAKEDRQGGGQRQGGKAQGTNKPGARQQAQPEPEDDDSGVPF
jgi:hypothetical protein